MSGIVSAPHGFCHQCDRALTRIEARDRSHKCARSKKHPAAELAARGAKAITNFERACNRAEYTDTGNAWELLYSLRATFNEIEAQL